MHLGLRICAALAVVWAGSACTGAATSSRRAGVTVASCGAAPAGVEGSLQPGQVTLFGEVHGTMEAPRFVGQVACLAAARGQRVVVGLEVGDRLQPAVDGYVRAAASAADREELLRGEHWQSTDGRGSVAMVALLDRLHDLAAHGADVKVHLFDARHADGVSRDQAMAESLSAEIEAEPKAVVLVLTGNLHSRTSESRWMGFSLKQKFPALRSYDFASAGGAAWNCSGMCGPNGLQGHDRGGAPRVVPFDTPNQYGYDGVYYLGRVTAAPPQGLAPAEAAKQIEAMPPPPPPSERSEAMFAYQEKAYDECTRHFRASAAQAQGKDLANDTYGAACCEARAGHLDQALATLKQAVSLGFDDRAQLVSDGDLVGLHDLAGWKELVESLGAAASAPPPFGK